MHIKIITTNLKNHKEIIQVINFGNKDSRDWLSAHMQWAVLHGRSVSINPVIKETSRV